jgi:hypothetical protein
MSSLNKKTTNFNAAHSTIPAAGEKHADPSHYLTRQGAHIAHLDSLQPPCIGHR